MAKKRRTSSPQRQDRKRGRDERPITSVAIFPPIGIARLGESTSDYFLGPELNPDEERPASYRDAEGKIKRQAARFHVFGFDARGTLVREITADDAEIEWSVQLANKKAAWFTFDGAEHARAAFANDDNVTNVLDPRNNNGVLYGRIVKNPKTGRYESDAKRKVLEIGPGSCNICGRSISPADGQAGDRYRFRGVFKKGVGGYAGTSVYLGELRTDVVGRLVVLGGHGISEPVGPNGPEKGLDRVAHWITSYVNNDDWYDDTSDGPVTATVRLRNGKLLTARPAWVIVTPPDFAPQVTNLVTLFDVMEEVALAAKLPDGPGTPKSRPIEQTSVEADVRPILERVNAYRWVSPLGLRGHGEGKPGAFDKNAVKATTALGDVGVSERDRFFSLIRKPVYLGLDPVTGAVAHTPDFDPGAIRQATAYFMPPLSGDQGDRTSGKASTWLTVTRLQYERLKAWRDGIPSGNAVGELPPARLTRVTLEACAGGAFYPGIEMTSIARDPTLYAESFRIDHDRISAGDITKFMACPWQADFYECRDDWWPAQRPDSVITQETYEQVAGQFSSDRAADLEAALFPRERWDRALDRTPWPDRSYIQNRLLPPPTNPNARAYAASAAELARDMLFGVSPASDLSRFISLDKSTEHLPNPWRLQYLTQEQLDRFAGRYFLPAVPGPDAVLSTAANDSGGSLLDRLKRAEKGLENVTDASALRRLWPVLRISHPAFVTRVTTAYVEAMKRALGAYLLDVFAQCPIHVPEAGTRQPPAAGVSDANRLRDALLAATSDPNKYPRDFHASSDEFKELRAGECVAQLTSLLFINACNTQGDNAMVDAWRRLGYVRTVKNSIIQVETDRGIFDGKSYRDYFYYLMNVERFPDFARYAKSLARYFLDSAQALIDMKANYDPNHPESYVTYSAETFAAKLEEIYEILRQNAAQPQQFVYKNTRADRVKAIIANGPFNQCDGAWLRHAANAGPLSEVRELLFSVWADEVGNGDPSLSHSNLYTTLLQTLGAHFPDTGSRDYSDDPRLSESTFVSPVFELAISEHTDEFYPEILGMTLYLEWEVLSLVPGLKRLDYFGIDSKFWRMHVGIDNASEGHGAKARQAVQLYLDWAYNEGGDAGQQEAWRRIWRGFVAFDVAGYNIFQSFERDGSPPLVLDTEKAKHTQTPEDRMVETIGRKQHYGSLNHLKRQLGTNRINDLFDDPILFLDELSRSPWIVPGKPDQSRLISYLTTFDGPMYEVFAKEDIAAWKMWIEWLGREGDTLRLKQHMTRCDAMLLLVTDMHAQMIGADGHQIYRVHNPGPVPEHMPTLAYVFQCAKPADILKILANKDNGWIVPYRPALSAIIFDLLRPARRMGQQLDRVFPDLLDQIGRMVIYEWIAAGCPIPGEPEPDPKQIVVTIRRTRRLLVEQFGTGAVH
jgi:L-Lysine epsilon oxidase N-terminal/L-lysine epsilon oxidase C-terminal domain/Iron-containing redox enzyme